VRVRARGRKRPQPRHRRRLRNLRVLRGRGIQRLEKHLVLRNSLRRRSGLRRNAGGRSLFVSLFLYVFLSLYISLYVIGKDLGPERLAQKRGPQVLTWPYSYICPYMVIGKALSP